jgi:hypothetical protein
MSVYAQLNVHFDFNRTPLATPGTRVIVHEKTDQRSSWDPHGVYGYYLDPALDHYRCYQVHVTKIKGTWIVDTVEFFPSKTAMPHTSSKDLSIIAALEMSNAVQNPAPAAPFSHIGTSQLQAMRQLSEILSAVLPSTTAQHATPLSQTSSKFRYTVPPIHGPEIAPPPPIQHPPVPATPSQYPRIVRYPSQRVRPRKATSLRVAPRMNTVDVSSPRGSHALPRNSVTPLTPHPAA